MPLNYNSLKAQTNQSEGCSIWLHSITVKPSNQHACALAAAHWFTLSSPQSNTEIDPRTAEAESNFQNPQGRVSGHQRNRPLSIVSFSLRLSSPCHLRRDHVLNERIHQVFFGTFSLIIFLEVSITKRARRHSSIVVTGHRGHSPCSDSQTKTQLQTCSLIKEHKREHMLCPHATITSVVVGLQEFPARHYARSVRYVCDSFGRPDRPSVTVIRRLPLQAPGNSAERNSAERKSGPLTCTFLLKWHTCRELTPRVDAD